MCFFFQIRIFVFFFIIIFCQVHWCVLNNINNRCSVCWIDRSIGRSVGRSIDVVTMKVAVLTASAAAAAETAMKTATNFRYKYTGTLTHLSICVCALSSLTINKSVTKKEMNKSRET